MKTLFAFFAVSLTCLTTSVSWGADILLREQATQHGSIIRLGDLADISAATATEVNNLASTPMLAAPAPGTQQFLTISQVRDLLAARGIQLDAIALRGAQVVQIGSASTLAKKTVAAVEKKLPADVQEIVEQAILTLIQQQTNHSNWRIETNLQQDDLDSLSALTNQPKIKGPTRIRSGRQRFLIDAAGKTILVVANCVKRQAVVVVKHPIERGQLVRTADVEIREHEGNLPDTVLVDLQKVIGQEAQRNLRADEVLQASHVRAPWLVRRGESVNVYVRTGGIAVRTRAIAKENGAQGDLISVELPEGKKRLDVSVSAPGEVTVFATGGQATDFATLNRNNRLRK